jgi:hypothetical protein
VGQVRQMRCHTTTPYRGVGCGVADFQGDVEVGQEPLLRLVLAGGAEGLGAVKAAYPVSDPVLRQARTGLFRSLSAQRQCDTRHSRIPGHLSQ